jgi:hypothetical protein
MPNHYVYVKASINRDQQPHFSRPRKVFKLQDHPLATILNTQLNSVRHMTCHAIARGFLRSTCGTKFTGSFTTTNNAQYIVAGNFSSSVPAFKSHAATLTYHNEESLSGTKVIEGTIGCDAINLKFSDGNQIDGVLDTPICPASSVCGTGLLTQS